MSPTRGGIPRSSRRMPVKRIGVSGLLGAKAQEVTDSVDRLGRVHLESPEGQDEGLRRVDHICTRAESA